MVENLLGILGLVETLWLLEFVVVTMAIRVVSVSMAVAVSEVVASVPIVVLMKISISFVPSVVISTVMLPITTPVFLVTSPIPSPILRVIRIPHGYILKHSQTQKLIYYLLIPLLQLGSRKPRVEFIATLACSSSL